jgi:hypothetical protein
MPHTAVGRHIGKGAPVELGVAHAAGEQPIADAEVEGRDSVRRGRADATRKRQRHGDMGAHQTRQARRGGQAPSLVGASAGVDAGVDAQKGPSGLASGLLSLDRLRLYPE